MGNKMCKKKEDTVDGNHPQSSPFVRIMSRLRLKPRWKSDSHLEHKNANRYDVPPLNGSVPNTPRPLSNSKSSDWTEVSLEVPEEEIKLKNPKLTFSNETDGTPQPPPRKHKKGIKEKIEAVAKSGLQALQSKKIIVNEPTQQNQQQQEPVNEPLFTKKTIIYDCPIDCCDERTHNRDHKHHRTSTPKINHKAIDRDAKRKKNLSVVSLPNYSELKVSLARDIDANVDGTDPELRKSIHSLPGETKKIFVYPEKKDYITRCRSFGSSLPQLLLHKLTSAKAPLAEIESDDSFGGLEDWDLKLIEHYNPKDSSLPRNTKPVRTDAEVLSDLESLIVKEEDAAPPPKPLRKSESLVKKINKTASETARKVSTGTEKINGVEATPTNVTPPPSPEREIDEPIGKIRLQDLPNKDEDGNVEHSGLLKILRDFGSREALDRDSSDGKLLIEASPKDLAAVPKVQSVTPKINSDKFGVSDFLNAERQNLTRENFKNNKLIVVDIQT